MSASSTTTAVVATTTSCPNTLAATDTEALVSVGAGTFVGVTGKIQASHNGTDYFDWPFYDVHGVLKDSGTTITLTDSTAAFLARVGGLAGMAKARFLATGWTSGSAPVTVTTGVWGTNAGVAPVQATGLSGTFSGATFNGTASIFSVMPTLPSTTVAAAGTNAATAGVLTTGFTLVSAADDTKGVVLPAAAAGLMCIIKSSVSNKILKVYPNTSDAINAIAADTAMSLASGPTPAIFFAYDATTWYTIPLLPS